MSNKRQQEEALFEAARALSSPAQRNAFLDQACAGDAGLRQRVEELLAAHQKAEQLFDLTADSKRKPDAGLNAERAGSNPTMRIAPLDEEQAGTVIGHYKLLQKIGEGGCGAVYMAEQQEPVRRRVALKVIKLGMDTRAVIARFEAERQALALMDHPNIAKVLDAGATGAPVTQGSTPASSPSVPLGGTGGGTPPKPAGGDARATLPAGRPYFVMELVRGIKITDYCDQNHLDTRQRLELFIQICHAIQHAHQKGIIHRDIKPSNILVTLHDGVPVPKVIDFGIAKATTDQRLTDKTLFTAYEQFIGTPAYMSPEQAEMSGLDIDTRSDIYSLGVLLYELLTGRTPFDPKELMKSGVDGMRKTIRELDPQRPSTRLATLQGEDLSTTAARHAAEAPKLISLLRGDLDWIVMKCLEKDRTRRYETANGVAADVQRYLANEPVVARPPSKLYRFQKLARRNKTAFTATAVGATALVIGLILSLYLFVKEKRALAREQAAEQVERQLRQQAEHSREASQQIARAGLLLMSGKYGESEHLLRDIPPHAALVPFYNTFGGVHARRGEWLEALTNWDLVVKYAPQDHMGYMYLAPLLLQLDDLAGYKNLRAQMLRQFGNTSDSRIAERMASASLLLPPTDDEMAVLARMADVATTGDTNSDGWGFNLFAKGFAEYREGHFTTAAEWLQRIPPLDVGWNCRTEAYLVLAMAQFQLHETEASNDSFAEALHGLTQKLRKPGHLDEQWNAWVADHLLLREAEALMPMAGKLESNSNHNEHKPAP